MSDINQLENNYPTVKDIAEKTVEMVWMFVKWSTTVNLINSWKQGQQINSLDEEQDYYTNTSFPGSYKQEESHAVR